MLDPQIQEAMMAERVVYLTISQAARSVGVSTDTIRLYERMGRLPALRTAGGYRLFAPSDVERLVRERAAQKKAKS